MNRYDTNQKGTSPALSQLINEFNKMPRSAFDESRVKDFDAMPYGIIPVECFLMFPNSEGYLRYDVQSMSKNPTIRRMLSSMRCELRTYKCRCSDLWEGWNNFVTRGRSGKLNLRIPNVAFEGNNVTTAVPYNPAHYLNIAPAIIFDDSQAIDYNTGFELFSRTTTEGGVTTEHRKATGLTSIDTLAKLQASQTYNSGISALPFVMYNKVGKEYQNPNLLQNNPYWYPENENHDLILPYNATTCRTACYDYPNAKIYSTVDSVQLNSSQPTNDKHSMPWLNVLYFRQRKGDYFNTGSPFPDLLRGDIPTIEVLSGKVDFTNSILSSISTNYSELLAVTKGGDDSKLGVVGAPENGTDEHDFLTGFYNSTYPDRLQVYDRQNSLAQFGNPTVNPSTNLLKALNKATCTGIEFSLNEWRKLATMTIFRERMARTDGSYNQMIQAQFNHNPNWHEHSVTYCGGSSQPMVFSEVVQNSSDSSTPLGTTAGRIVSSSGSDEIYVKADDYTIFMTVLTITPDNYLSQGIDRMWTELTQAEQYFPIMNNLEPQAILNKELFVSGTDNTDNDVFNYQERFSHFKSRQNQISGLMSLPISKVGDTGAYVFNRLFNSTPNFNNAFVTGKFTDNENLCFASTEQAQFIMHISSQFKYVAPLPAVTTASDVGISY